MSSPALKLCAMCGPASICAKRGGCLRDAARRQYVPAGVSRDGVLQLPKVPSEHEEQVRFFAWCTDNQAQHPELAEFFAVPNGGKRQLTVAKKLKAEGVKPGVEDIVLLVARGGYHGLLLEMKRQDATASDVKPEQVKWHAIHTKRGFRVVVCKGAEEAQREALDYLARPKTRVT